MTFQGADMDKISECQIAVPKQEPIEKKSNWMNVSLGKNECVKKENSGSR